MIGQPPIPSDAVLAGLALLLVLWVLAGAGVGLHLLTGWLGGPVTYWPFAQLVGWARRGFHRRPRFVFAECQTCGFTIVSFDPAWLRRIAALPANLIGSLECPRCFDHGRHVMMALRPVRPEDRAKGIDLRRADDSVLKDVIADLKRARR